jgi:ribosomal protein S18 acetylase RimI-like enzyme
MAFTLRPAGLADREFLWILREAAMRPLLEPLLGWNEAQQRAYADESLRGRIVIVDGAAGGVLTVVARGAERHLAFVGILPPLQGAGLGTALVRLAQDEAAAGGLLLSLHVLSANPAVRLYSRLGFEVETTGAVGHGVDRLRMCWRPNLRPSRG